MGLGPIVDTTSLASGEDGPIFCDVRWYLDGRSGRDAYDAGHLPGAVFVDLEKHLTAMPGSEVGRHPLPDPGDLARSLGSLGIGPNHPVVAYDDAGGMSAGRLVWMLRILGQSAALLDGGIEGWNGPLEVQPSARAPIEVPVRPWPDGAFVDIGTAAEADVLLDARAPERYRGDVEPVDPRAGHVPGAVNAPFTANLADGRFLSPEDLANRYRALGVVDASEVVAYCGSGVSACHDLLAMEHAGLGRGRLFVGSWSQWSASDRPIATGDGRDT